MSSPTKPQVVTHVVSDDSVPEAEPVANSDEPMSSRDLTGDYRPPIETNQPRIVSIEDLSPLTVTSPLEALALACVAEKEQTDQQNGQPESNPPNKNDVLCGRGGLTNNHPGNVFFRGLVNMKQESYLMATKREKAGVAREIVETIRSLQPPGRFLKKDPKNSMAWIEIGDRKAREKTSQALREGAPELREELQTAEQQLGSPHMIEQQQPMASQFSHPRKFFKPSNSWGDEQGIIQDAYQLANRARIVSDDSVVGGVRPLFQHTGVDYKEGDTAGSKRKVDESVCAIQEQAAAQRGPRLKLLLKKRLAV